MRCCRDLLMHSFRDSFKNSYRNSFRRSIQNFSRSSFWFFFAGIHSKNHADVSFEIYSVASSGVLFEMSPGVPGSSVIPPGVIFRILPGILRWVFRDSFKSILPGVPLRVPPMVSSWNPAVFSVEITSGVPYSTIALDIPPFFFGIFPEVHSGMPQEKFFPSSFRNSCRNPSRKVLIRNSSGIPLMHHPATHSGVPQIALFEIPPWTPSEIPTRNIFRIPSCENSFLDCFRSFYWDSSGNFLRDSSENIFWDFSVNSFQVSSVNCFRVSSEKYFQDSGNSLRDSSDNIFWDSS